MKYLVMECRPSYSVVLDEEGRFKKVANIKYEVGQTVYDVVEMEEVPSEDTGKKANIRVISLLAAAAACLLLVFIPLFNIIQTPYASVYMTINPSVRIDVNENYTVVGLNGINDDGKKLIEGYSYNNKLLEPVMEDLVDLAIEQGYLYSGSKITLDLDADDDEWINVVRTDIDNQLSKYISQKIIVTVEVGVSGSGYSEPDKEVYNPITVPIDGSYGESDYTSSESSKEPNSSPKYDNIGNSSSSPSSQQGGPEYSQSSPGTDYGQSSSGRDTDYNSSSSSGGDSNYSSSSSSGGDSNYSSSSSSGGDSNYSSSSSSGGDSNYSSSSSSGGDSNYSSSSSSGGDSNYDSLYDPSEDSNYG